ncbi:hypothetical protein [Pseudenhygromyxa sp. WMMC2535]|uniref:hypothetical protein n=1 Tax=Pseudenhygromyxa sp. WMMC2535 TaxID=2712867 RepID=UPI0031F78F37
MGESAGALCGNGVLEPGEVCDDGNLEVGDGCSPACEISACGMVWSASVDIDSAVEGASDLTVDAAGELYLAGLRVEADRDIWLLRSDEHGPVWSVSVDGGQGNDGAEALAFGPSGELLVAGWQARAGEAIWYAAYDAADGGELWSQIVDAEGPNLGSDDRATALATTPTGDAVVVGNLRVGENDDDVWVRRFDAADGEAIWDATWSGVGDGTWSIDRAGAVGIANDGTVWVGGRRHDDYDSHEAVLLHFDAEGVLLDEIQPRPSGDHIHDPVALAVDSNGSLYFAIESQGAVFHSWLYRLDASGAELWVKTEADWATHGSRWRTRGVELSAAGGIAVAGSFDNEDEFEALEWGEAWVARLDAAGNFVCRGTHMVDDGAIIPPSLLTTAVGVGAGGAIGLGARLEAGQGSQAWLWLAYFRG